MTKVLEGALSYGAEIEKIYLNDLEIKPCQDCDKSPAPDYYVYEDGMGIVYKALDMADALIIGTPAYYESISSQLKLLSDRCNCISEMTVPPDNKLIFKSRFVKKKKGVFIWVADSSKNPEHAFEMIKVWCKYANVELVETMIAFDSDRGEGARK